LFDPMGKKAIRTIIMQLLRLSLVPIEYKTH